MIAIPSNNSFGGVLADELLFIDVAHYCSLLLYLKTLLLYSQYSHAIIYTTLSMMCHVISSLFLVPY